MIFWYFWVRECSFDQEISPKKKKFAALPFSYDSYNKFFSFKILEHDFFFSLFFMFFITILLVFLFFPFFFLPFFRLFSLSLSGDYQQAEKQADIAIRSDRYHAITSTHTVYLSLKNIFIPFKDYFLIP